MTPREIDADELRALTPERHGPSRSELLSDVHEDALDARYQSRHRKPCDDFLAALDSMRGAA